MNIMQHPIWRNELFWKGINLIMWLCLIGIVYLSQQDAAFYCQNYCEASGGEFRMYTPGSCSCRSTIIEITGNFSDIPLINVTRR